MIASFGIYSLKAGIILTLFWIVYRLFLRKETFFRFNRVFLFAGLIAALVFPFIIIRYPVEIIMPAIPVSQQIVSETASSTGAYFDGLTIIAIAYLAVLIVLCIVRGAGFVRLFKTMRRNNIKRCDGYNLVETADFDVAFSFFRFVFLPLNLNETQKHIILRHEKAHIKQNHWIDLFVVNILKLLWWFNPVIWFYDKAIRNNHEYLADQAVLGDYALDVYQQTLLNQWFTIPVFPMAHTFAFTNNLNRIMMMKKNISNPLKKIAVLLLIPVLCFFLWAFAEPVYNIKTDNVVEYRQDTLKIRSLNSSNNGSPLIIIDGQESSKSLNEIDPANIASITVLKDATAMNIYGEKGKNGVVLITTKVNAQDSSNSSEIKTTDSAPAHIAAHTDQRIVDFLSNFANALLYVDGEEVSNTDNLNADDIESISVLKNGAINRYGEKGKNGVVIITMKKN